MRDVLITGGLGFIGSCLTRQLRAKGITVTILDNWSPQIHGTVRSIENEQGLVVGDIRDKELLFQLVSCHNTVVHMAAETGTGQSMYEIERYVDVNVRGTACLMEAVMKCGRSVERIVLASSRAVYGEGKYLCKTDGIFYPAGRRDEDLASRGFEMPCPLCGELGQPVPTDESARLKPASVYAVTKHAQEELVVAVTRAIGINAVLLRLQNVFGPGQSLLNPYTGILSIFANSMRAGESINIFEDGRATRDFVYVEDVADAFVSAITAPLVGAHVLNIGSGEPRTVLDVATALKRKLNSSSPLEITANYRRGDIRHNCADIAAARHWLNFTPAHSFDQGLSKFVEWVKTQPRPDRSDYHDSLGELKQRGLLK